MTEQAPEPENEENERSTQYRKWDFALPVLVPVLEMGCPFPVLVNCAFGYLHLHESVTITGAFLKTQRHNNIGHKDTILCLFNPIFNPNICMLVIKTQICRTSPPRSANLCPDIFLTYLFISPLNVPLLVTEKSRTPPPPPLSHATAPRRHQLAKHPVDAFADDNGETVVATHECQQAIFYLISHMRRVH